MTNPWEVHEEEYQKNVVMFGQLTSGLMFMDAATARNALMRSNLPTQILSQIWTLADLDKDGRLDIREYSIAMKLALNCLAGMHLPSQLPPSLLIIPTRSASNQPGAPHGWPRSRHGSIDHSQTLPVGSDHRMSHSQAYFSAPPPVAYTPSAPVSIAGTPSRHNSISTSSPINTDRSIFDGRQLENWVIPHHNKLKYSQLFNSLDKDRMGSLSSQVGRSALGLSGLPTNVLAHIWFLSDVNQDGKLSVDEYAISQYMIEMFKSGYSLPKATPPELVRMCGISSRSANNTPELEPGAEPPQKSPAPKTFEDKRQDNFSKGQAELERRRRILEEEEQRRRAEVEKKEREEEAKRERERMEKERQAEAERHAELERVRLVEAQKEEEERERRAELEKRKEEEEKTKKHLMEKARIKQMQNQKQQENERLAQRQQREKTLLFQLQALDEKATDVETDIVKAKEAITDFTNSIELMRSNRDEKVMRIKRMQEDNQKTAIESQELGHQLLQKQSAHKETTQRKNEFEALRRKRDTLKKAIEDAALELSAEKEKTFNQSETLKLKKTIYQSDIYSKLVAKREEYRKIFELYAHSQTHAKSKIGEFETHKADTAQVSSSSTDTHVQQIQHNSNFDDAFAEFDRTDASHKFDTDFGSSSNVDPFASATIPEAAQSHAKGAVDQSSFNIQDTHKCRALFAFEARSEDELSFEPGDVIIVFKSHAAEPGWRAGQLREKVGWFPEAFVESIAAIPAHGDEPPMQNMPPNVTPSSSIDQLGARIARKAEIDAAMGVETSVITASPLTVISECIAQFQWRARNDDDLSFSKGDAIEVLEKQDMKWRGRNPNGQIGWFPKSYVKEVGSSSTPVTSPSKPILPQSPTNCNTQYDMVPVDLTNSEKDASEKLYTAIYDFEAAESTDLALSVGDTIVVLEKNDEWWKGRCKGKEGIFPANYVEVVCASNVVTSPIQTAVVTSQVEPNSVSPPTVICEAKAIVDFTASAPNQLGIRVGEVVQIREKSATGWWEGELIRDGKPIAGWFPGDYVKVVEVITQISPSMSLRAIALYDYQASQIDELTFQTGDVLVVTDRSDAEWWSGHTAQKPSKSGLFPSNYVELK